MISFVISPGYWSCGFWSGGQRLRDEGCVSDYVAVIQFCWGSDQFLQRPGTKTAGAAGVGLVERHGWTSCGEWPLPCQDGVSLVNEEVHHFLKQQDWLQGLWAYYIYVHLYIYISGFDCLFFSINFEAQNKAVALHMASWLSVFQITKRSVETWRQRHLANQSRIVAWQW